MLAVCVVPFILLAVASDHPMSITVVGGKDSGFTFDYGLLLSQAPGALATALLAPLVGYRRRVALWFLVPPVNLYFAWVIGVFAAELGAPAEQRLDCGEVQVPSLGRRAEELIREGLKR